MPLNITERSCTLGCYISDLKCVINAKQIRSVVNAEYFHLPPSIAHPKLKAMAHFSLKHNYPDDYDEDNTHV